MRKDNYVLERGSALHGDKTPEWDREALGSQKGLGFKRIRFIVFSCSRRPRWGPPQTPPPQPAATCTRWPYALAERRSWAARVPAASHCGEGTGRGQARGPGAPRPPAAQRLAFLAPDPDPVGRLLAGHERLQVVAAQVVGWPLVDPLWEPLQEAHGHVPTGGAQG